MLEIIRRALVDRWGERTDHFDWRTHQTPLDLAALENVLVLNLNGKLGDALMVSLMVDAFAQARPDLPIHVGATAGYVEYWRRNPLVREVVVLPSSKRAGRSTERRVLDARRTAGPLRGRFEAVVSFEPYALPDHFLLFRTLGAKVNIGFNKHPYRLFTHSLEERRHTVVAESVATRTARVMEVFGRSVDLDALRFSAPFVAEDARTAQAVIDLAKVEGPRLLFNAYGAGPEKCLTPASTVRGVREIRDAGHAGPIFLSVPSGEEEPFARALRAASLDAGMVTFGPMADFFKLFALVSKMDVVVSPDTAVGHVAAAFRKPQVCLFAFGGTIPTAWKPFSDRCVALRSTSGRNVNDLDWPAFAAAVRKAIDDSEGSGS